MMRKPLPFFFVPTLLTALLAGCGSSSTGIGTCNCPAAPQGIVSISMTDDPPAGVSILFFQVTLSKATLTPTSGSAVSLLYNDTPRQVDVTQLQALSAFLSSAAVTAGTYNSLNLTFSNPQLVIYNQSDSSLGSTCAVGSICQLTPAFDSNSSTVTITSSPFPVTVSTTSPLAFVIDFHLNTVIQSDLSVNLSVANGVTVSELPPAPTPRQYGFATGTVTDMVPSSGQIEMTSLWGGGLNLLATSSTTYSNFPSSACTTPSIQCVAQGQVIQVQISGYASSGLLTVSQVTYVQAANTQTVQGTIIQVIPSTTNIAGAPPMGFVMLLHSNPTSAVGFPLGGTAEVSLPGNATYSIDADGFTMPSGLNFTSASNLIVGQNVTVTVSPGTLSTTGAGPGPNAWGPPPSMSFTASAVELEPSQMTGSITATNSSTTSFTLGVAGSFFAPWPLPSATSSYNVATTNQTTYAGFTQDNFGGLATDDFVSVSGWLFPPGITGGSPTIAAQSVVLRPSQSF
jgi:hypothetical protein